MSAGNGNGDRGEPESIAPRPMDPRVEQPTIEESVHVLEGMVGHVIGEQRRQDDVIRGTARDVAEIKGVMMRVESVTYSIAAKLEVHFREHEPVPLERIQELRKFHEEQAKKLETLKQQATREKIKTASELKTLEFQIAEARKDAEEAKDKAEDTDKRASNHAIEVLLDERKEIKGELKAKVEKDEAKATEWKIEKWKIALVIIGLIVPPTLAWYLGTHSSPAHVPEHDKTEQHH